MSTDREPSRALPLALTSLLMLVAGFFAGGVYARATLPAGMGLAGGATAAIYALFGAVVAMGVGIGVVFKAPLERRWTLTAGAGGLTLAALAAFMVVPRPALPPPEPPPPAYEPEFTVALQGDLDAEPSPSDPLVVPFRRIDVHSGSAVRTIPAGDSVACNGALPTFPQLDELLAATRAVYAACQGAPEVCSATPCTDCTPYQLFFSENPSDSPWISISGAYLSSSVEGRTLISLLERAYEGAQPWSHCGN